MLTLDPSGKYGKSLNIHTRIDHLTNHNTYKFSLIGIHGEPSCMNLDVDVKSINGVQFSRREIDIIKCTADGLSSTEIEEKSSLSANRALKSTVNISWPNLTVRIRLN